MQGLAVENRDLGIQIVQLVTILSTEDGGGRRGGVSNEQTLPEVCVPD